MLFFVKKYVVRLGKVSKNGAHSFLSKYKWLALEK